MSRLIIVFFAAVLVSLPALSLPAHIKADSAVGFADSEDTRPAFGDFHSATVADEFTPPLNAKPSLHPALLTILPRTPRFQQNKRFSPRLISIAVLLPKPKPSHVGIVEIRI